MSYYFESAATRRFFRNLSPDLLGATGVPLSVFAQFWVGKNPAAAQCILGTGDLNFDTVNMLRMNIASTGALTATTTDNGAGASTATSTNLVRLQQWNVGLARWASVTDRRAMLNADLAAQGSDVVSRSPNNINRISIGSRPTSPFATPFDGFIVKAAWWTRALSDAEAELVSRSADPTKVMQDLYIYYDFTNPRGGSMYDFLRRQPLSVTDLATMPLSSAFNPPKARTVLHEGQSSILMGAGCF